MAEYKKGHKQNSEHPHWNEATLSHNQPKKGKALVCAYAAAEEGFCSYTASLLTGRGKAALTGADQVRRGSSLWDSCDRVRWFSITLMWRT